MQIRIPAAYRRWFAVEVMRLARQIDNDAFFRTGRSELQHVATIPAEMIDDIAGDFIVTTRHAQPLRKVG